MKEVQPRHLGRLLAEQGGGDEDGGGAGGWKIISGNTIHKYGGENLTCQNRVQRYPGRLSPPALCPQVRPTEVRATKFVKANESEPASKSLCLQKIPGHSSYRAVAFIQPQGALFRLFGALPLFPAGHP